MTKKFEQRVALPLSQLRQWVQQADHLGECVLVISGKPPIIRIKQSKYVKDAPIQYVDSMDQAQVTV